MTEATNPVRSPSGMTHHSVLRANLQTWQMPTTAARGPVLLPEHHCVRAARCATRWLRPANGVLFALLNSTILGVWHVRAAGSEVL